MESIRNDGQMSSKRLAEVREYERLHNKSVKEFDQWFYKLPKAQQDELRSKNVLPYAEQLSDPYVFNYDEENRNNTVLDSTNDSANDETFYSREKVEEYTRRLLETLEYSHSPEVRLHFQMVRIALRDHRAMSGEVLAKLYGMTRAGINFRVQRIREIMTGKPRKLSGKVDTPTRKSTLRGGKPRVASHPGKKLRKNPRFSKGC